MSKEISRRKFLASTVKGIIGAGIWGLSPHPATADSRVKNEKPDVPFKKEIALELINQENPEGLFEIYDKEIREAIRNYENSRNTKSIFSPTFLKSFFLCLSGSIPTRVSGTSPSGEQIGLGRIHKNQARLLDETVLDLTNPSVSAQKAIELLTSFIEAETKKSILTPAQILKEAIYDYIDGPERQGSSQQALFLTELTLTLYNDVAYGQRKLLPNLANFPIINQIIKEGLRYHQFSPSWPIDPKITQSVYANFMEKTQSQPEGHWGWDFVGPPNSEVRAVAPGIVVWTKWAYGQKDTNTGHGPTVILDHGGLYTVYAHLDEEVPIFLNQSVKKGDLLGHVGDMSRPRGASSDPHLHFGVYSGGKISVQDEVAQLADGKWIHPLSMLPEKANYPGRTPTLPPLTPEIPRSVLPLEGNKPRTKEVPEMEIASNGRELIKKLGLEKKVILIVYGRPGGHGSLGPNLTAEGSWQICLDRKNQVINALAANPVKIGNDNQPLNEKDLIWPCINPVDQCRLADGKISARLADIYVLKALELATENNGGFVIDLGVSGIDGAKKVIEHIETITKQKFASESGGLTKACKWLSHLGFTWDLEWMPGNVQTKPDLLNEPNLWYAQKHIEWNKIAGVATPGIVGIYAFKPLVNLKGVKQHYPECNTLVPILFDGYGNAGVKLSRLGELRQQLEQGRTTSEINHYPPLLGIMEFTFRWGQGFDQGAPSEHLRTLNGAPTFFFAIQ